MWRPHPWSSILLPFLSIPIDAFRGHPILYFEDEFDGPTISEIKERLENGDPAIFVGGGSERAEINIVMVNVQDGEEIVIADRMNEILR